MACASTTLDGLSPTLETEALPIGEILCFFCKLMGPESCSWRDVHGLLCLPRQCEQEDCSSFSEYSCLGFLVFKVVFVCNLSFGSYNDLERQVLLWGGNVNPEEP